MSSASAANASASACAAARGARPLGRRERGTLLEREGEPPAGRQRREYLADQGVLVFEGKHRLEQEDDIERAGWEGRDLRSLEAAGQVARALAGDRDGARAGVHPQVGAAQLAREEPPRPGDAAAQVQHRDSGGDAGPHRQGPDLAGRHEALLPDELAGRVRRRACAVQRPVERRPVVLPHDRGSCRLRSIGEAR
jgi:hypothetical protein